MPWNAAERFVAWSTREEDGSALLLFRRAFTAIWLVYDVLDLFLQGTSSGAWMFPDLGALRLKLVQGALIVFQALLLLGVWPRLFAFLCFALRLSQAWFFLSLNDFYYYSVVMLILSQARIDERGKAPAWIRDVLVWQAAWIYFATGTLKLNPEWLSGGHLFVRFQYMAAIFEWPYPAFFRDWIDELSHVAWLSYAGAGLELSLAAMLAFRAPKWLTVAAAIALHVFAALATNVWFFGAAMVAQVALARDRTTIRNALQR